jgi:hypothetical protein
LIGRYGPLGAVDHWLSDYEKDGRIWVRKSGSANATDA